MPRTPPVGSPRAGGTRASAPHSRPPDLGQPQTAFTLRCCRQSDQLGEREVLSSNGSAAPDGCTNLHVGRPVGRVEAERRPGPPVPQAEGVSRP